MEKTYDLNDVLNNFSTSLHVSHGCQAGAVGGGLSSKPKEYNPAKSAHHQQNRAATDSLNNSMFSTTLSQSLNASQDTKNNSNGDKSLLSKLAENKHGQKVVCGNDLSNGGKPKSSTMNRMSQKSSRVVPVESYSSSDDEHVDRVNGAPKSANNDDENNNDFKSDEFDDDDDDDDDDADDDDANDDQDFIRKKNDDNDSESFYDAVDQK
jgi:hypothetical protein